MPPLTISQLTTDQKEPKLSVRVSRKWIPYNSKNDSVICLEFVVIDAEGNDIWVRVPKDKMKEFEDRVQEQRFYEFANFSVKLTQKNYRPVGNRLMIDFTDHTTVRPIEEIPGTPAYKFRFLETSDLPDLNDRIQDLMDVAGQLVKCLPTEIPKSSSNRNPRRDMMIKLSDGHIIKVSLWGRIIAQLNSIVRPTENSTVVVVVTSLFVRTWNKEFYLSSSSATRLYANLEIPEVAAIQKHLPRNDAPQLLDVQSVQAVPTVTIEELCELRSVKKDQRTFQLDCTVSKVKENWFYNGCAFPQCRKLVQEEADGFFCGKCKTTSKEAVKRFRIVIAVFDTTASTELVLLDHTASTHFDSSAQQLFTDMQDDVTTPHPTLLALEGQELKLQIRISDYDYSNPSSRLTVMNILEARKTVTTDPSNLMENEDHIASGHSSCLSINTNDSPPRSPTQLQSHTCPGDFQPNRGCMSTGTPTTHSKRKHDAIVTSDEE